MFNIRNNVAVKSALRVLDIFEAMASCPEGLGITKIATRLSIPKSSASNLIWTLAERQYVVEVRPGRFGLGPRLFEVGACSTTPSRLHAVARPVMARLQVRTGETVSLGALTPGLDVLVLDKVLATHVIRYDADVGETVPAYCTAIGKALLAELPRERLDDYLRTRPRPRLTPRTITGRKGLMAELERIRQQGFAINVEERVVGASAVAAPVYARPGRAVAAILVGGPTSRMLKRRENLARAVKRAAAEISAALDSGDERSRDGARIRHPPAG